MSDTTTPPDPDAATCQRLTAGPLPANPPTWALYIAAQAWCEPETGAVVMHEKLAAAFARILARTVELAGEPDTRCGELQSVLAAVQGELRRHRNALPDGFDSRVLGWVDDALAGRAVPSIALPDAMLRVRAEQWALQRQEPAPEPSEDARDAARYRWLVEDHANPTTRTRCRELLRRLPVMGKGAADAAIDAERQAEHGQG